MKTHIIQQTKHHLRHNTLKHVVFKIPGIVYNLSMMRISYKLREEQKLKKLKNH